MPAASPTHTRAKLLRSTLANAFNARRCVIGLLESVSVSLLRLEHQEVIHLVSLHQVVMLPDQTIARLVRFAEHH